MKISISIQDISTRIYALSAYRAVTADSKATPRVLTRDNAKLLRRLIRHAFALTVGALNRRVTDFGRLDPDDGNDVLWLEMEIGGVKSGVASELLTAAVLGRVLWLAHGGGGDESDSYMKLAGEAEEKLQGQIVATGRLTRHCH